jgi:hypothetical protein
VASKGLPEETFFRSMPGSYRTTDAPIHITLSRGPPLPV